MSQARNIIQVRGERLMNCSSIKRRSSFRRTRESSNSRWSNTRGAWSNSVNFNKMNCGFSNEASCSKVLKLGISEWTLNLWPRRNSTWAKPYKKNLKLELPVYPWLINLIDYNTEVEAPILKVIKIMIFWLKMMAYLLPIKHRRLLPTLTFKKTVIWMM